MQISGRKTVLVVDDELMLRRLYLEMLKKIGYQPLIAENHAEAMELFKANSSNIICVVLDVNIPKVDGFETMKAIKALAPDTKIILSSGLDRTTVINKHGELEDAHYIQKPYNTRQLKEAIEHVIFL